jgi:hypothetical protein
MDFLKTRKLWLGLAIAVTIQAGVIYIAVQQSLRFAANQPQKSMANGAAADLESGKRPADLAKGYVDMAHTMAPFIIIYDQYGKVVAGNGYLDNRVPQVPIGVLSAAKGHKINEVSWEPSNGVRIAAVSVQGGNYYVLGGRSLEDTEHYIKWFGQWLAALWGIAFAATILGFHWARRQDNRRTPEPANLAADPAKEK